MNVPNTLTLLRILCAVIVFTLMGLHRYDLALLFFLAAALTDFLDGWWARRYNQITVFGRVMDPFADKLLICGAFVCLVAIPEMTDGEKNDFPAWLLLQSWMVIVIIGRELLVTSLRAFIEGAGGDFSAKWLGKLKMVLQCVAIILALLYLSGGATWNIVSYDIGKEAIVPDYYTPQYDPLQYDPDNVTEHTGTLLAQGLDHLCRTKAWRKVVFFSMLSTFWLTIGITLLSGLDYCIHAARMIRKQRERMDELYGKQM